MTKHKSVVAILLAIMMVFTFMPTMSFAAAGDPDDVVCKVTLSNGTTVERTSIADAIGAVDEGGKIVIEGTVNNSPVVNGAYSYTIDYSKATLAEGVEIKPAETACWVGKDGVFTYHANHTYENAEATPTAKDASRADVVVYCKNGDSVILKDKQGVVDSETDTTIVYEYDCGANYGNVVAKWSVSKTTEVVYSMLKADIDYNKANDGFAILDASGKVSFYAYYKQSVNGGAAKYVLDDNGDKVKLNGTIVEKLAFEEGVDTKATKTVYGTHRYKVEFAFPDGKKAEFAGEKFAVVSAADTPKLSAEKGDVVGVQFKYEKITDGKDVWSSIYDDASGKVVFEFISKDGAEATEATAYAKRVFGADGSLTYRIVYDDKNDDNPESVVYGDAKTLAPKAAGTNGSTVYACGTATYVYPAITETYTTGAAGNVKTFSFTPNDIDVVGEHAYADRANWAKDFEQVTKATHATEGTATAECKYCQNKWTEGKYYPIPKTADHKFVKESATSTVDKVVTVAPTCQDYGFQYKICETPDGGWVDGKYVLKLDDKKTGGKKYTFKNMSEFEISVGVYGHPVLVEGSVKDKVDHKYFVTSVAWSPDDETLATLGLDDDVVCTVNKTCMYDTAHTAVFAYHKISYADAKKANPQIGDLMEGSTDTVEVSANNYAVYGAVNADYTAGADCTKYDTATYTVKGVTDADGKAISKSVVSKTIAGPHTYKNTVTFSKDGKSATVLLQCTNKDCEGKKDAAGNDASMKLDAVVSAADNADGSTTYTATLEGYQLTNNTKTLFNLDKAVVTVNDGKVIDLNTLDVEGAAEAAGEDAEAEYRATHSVERTGSFITGYRYYVEDADGRRVSEYFNSQSAAEAFIDDAADDAYKAAYNETLVDGESAALKKLVKVTINGVEISDKLYKVENEALVEGANKINIVSVNEAKAVGTAKGVAQIVVPGVFSAGEYTLDGKDYKSSVEFDGKTHTIALKSVYNGEYLEVEGFAVKYAVVTVADTQKKAFDPEKLSYDLDTVELTNAGEYVIFSKVSKEGYTSDIFALYFEITPQEVDYPTITTKTQVITYGDTGFVATTGDAATDKLINLQTVDASKLGVGIYSLADLVTYDKNYAVSATSTKVTIEKRNATIVMLDDSKTYDGKPADVSSLFTIDGVVNGDTLNVIVNVKGGKTPVNAGKYTLVATANDANYNIETVTATYTINKIAQKVNSISPAKRSYTANSKGKLAKKKTFMLSADVTGSKAAKLTFSKVSGNSKITVTSAGKVTVKKGLKAGTYTLKVKATKAGTKNYAKATKTKSIKIVIKKKSK